MEQSCKECLMRPDAADESAPPVPTLNNSRRARFVWLTVAAACLVAAALLVANIARPLAGPVRFFGDAPRSGGMQRKVQLPAIFSSGPTLFCWCIMRADSYERDILEAQHGEGAGIFECDGQMVFSDVPVSIGGDFDTEPIGSLSSSLGGQGALATSPRVNTENFFHAWDSLRSNYRFEDYDFVVKLDPDTVFIADFLKQYLVQHGIPADNGLYLDNCPQVDNGFYGCIEVMSNVAFGGFMENFDQCRQMLAWEGWGEDLFAQKCMDSMGMIRQGAYDLVMDGNCHGPGAPPACAPGMVAYHPLKDADAWLDCWAQANGQGEAPAFRGSIGRGAPPGMAPEEAIAEEEEDRHAGWFPDATEWLPKVDLPEFH
mmetsp:Transcript_16972/g.48224  ORF Transcript_16972/g.48224 Transcript_16972/m.48224 type:complete len:372 (+) Transcript_16972:83-1198(+)